MRKCKDPWFQTTLCRLLERPRHFRNIEYLGIAATFPIFPEGVFCPENRRSRQRRKPRSACQRGFARSAARSCRAGRESAGWVPVEPGVDQRKAGTRKVLALSPHWAGASSSSSEACGAPGTKAAPAAEGSRAWVLRRPLDGLGFHHAQNSSEVDKELPACRVRTGGRGDERAMAWQSDGTVHKQTSCLVSGHEFASALIAGGLSGISADGIFNGLNSLLFLMRGVPECAGGKQTGKRADHGASGPGGRGCAHIGLSAICRFFHGAPRGPPLHLPPAGLADPAALPHSRRSSRGRWRIQRAITGRPRACCTCWLRLLFVRPSMPLADCSSRPGAALHSEPTAECQTANARRGGAASPEGAGWRVVIGFGSPAGRRTPRGPLVSKRQTGALTALHASSATGQAKAAPSR